MTSPTKRLAIRQAVAEERAAMALERYSRSLWTVGPFVDAPIMFERQAREA